MVKALYSTVLFIEVIDLQLFRFKNCGLNLGSVEPLIRH
jgi:hypothetical protein